MSAYTKKRAVEQIWLAINGGKTDPNSDVMRADIESYLPAAINHVVSEDIKERRILAIRERRRGDYSVNDLMIEYEYTPQYDSNRAAYKIVLNFIVPSVGGMQYISVMPLRGSEDVIMLSKRTDAFGIETALGQYGWLERTETGHTIWFKNLLCADCPLVVQTVCDYDSLKDDVVMPVSDGLWARIIELCVNHFTKQRLTPANETVDGTDEIDKRA